LDFAQVDGLDNLSQSLAMALTTTLGSDVFNVQHGFDGLNALADETNPVLQRERIRVGIIQVLRKDARVRQVLDVMMDGGPLTPLEVPGSRVLHVRVEFQAVTADNVSTEMTTGRGLT
jgi:phage baseplate assembly protein W